MIATHHIESIALKDEKMILVVDGQTVQLPLDQISIKLLNANEMERQLFVISPSGYGIHWPLLDEDLSIVALLKTAGLQD